MKVNFLVLPTETYNLVIINPEKVAKLFASHCFLEGNSPLEAIDDCLSTILIERTEMNADREPNERCNDVYEPVKVFSFPRCLLGVERVAIF